MEIYIAELILIVALGFLGYGKTEGERRAYLIVVFVLLALVSGLRSTSVGTDTLLYSALFERIVRCNTLDAAFGSASLSAPIYVAYNWLLGRVTTNYQVLLLINSFLLAICIARFIYVVSEDYVISSLCFVALALYFQSMNIMREYVAAGIAINSYLCICKSGYKSLLGWLLLVIAVGIHSTSIFMLMPIACLIYIQTKKTFKKSVRTTFIAILIIGLMFVPLIDVFMNIFPYYRLYGVGGRVSIFEAAGNGRSILLYLFLGLFVIAAYWKLDSNSSWKDEPTSALLFPVAICAVVFGAVFYNNVLMNRMVSYFLIGFVAFIPYVAKGYSGGARILIYLATFIVLGVWCAFQLLENKSGIVPYLLGF